MCKQCHLDRIRSKYNDPIYYENKLKQQRQKYQNLPKELKDKKLESNRNRWKENYQTKYKATHDEWHKVEHKRTKYEVMKLCGKGQAACVICGIKDIDVLAIDHINGRKGEERKTKDIKKNHYGFPFWRKILNGKLKSTDFQTLCMNCNWKRHLEGIKNHD